MIIRKYLQYYIGIVQIFKIIDYWQYPLGEKSVIQHGRETFSRYLLAANNNSIPIILITGIPYYDLALNSKFISSIKSHDMIKTK